MLKYLSMFLVSISFCMFSVNCSDYGMPSTDSQIGESAAEPTPDYVSDGDGVSDDVSVDPTVPAPTSTSRGRGGRSTPPEDEAEAVADALPGMVDQACVENADCVDGLICFDTTASSVLNRVCVAVSQDPVFAAAVSCDPAVGRMCLIDDNTIGSCNSTPEPIVCETHLEQEVAGLPYPVTEIVIAQDPEYHGLCVVTVDGVDGEQYEYFFPDGSQCMGKNGVLVEDSVCVAARCYACAAYDYDLSLAIYRECIMEFTRNSVQLGDPALYDELETEFNMCASQSVAACEGYDFYGLVSYPASPNLTRGCSMIFVVEFCGPLHEVWSLWRW